MMQFDDSTLVLGEFCQRGGKSTQFIHADQSLAGCRRVPGQAAFDSLRGLIKGRIE